ncbi:type II secretion system protein [bacterium]|nr:type II secretion system protein [bacterium]
MDTKKRIKNRKNAFTMTELMIVLVAVGFVAITVMPVIISRHQTTVTVNRLQKSYSVVSAAFTRARAVNGPVYNWDIRNNHAAEDVFNIIKPHLKINKVCGNQTNQNCVAQTYGRLNNNGTDGGDGDTRYYKSILADGSSFAVRMDNINCTIVKGENEYLKHICGIAFVDINGVRKPNVAGKDKFEFYITSYGIYPRGSRFETSISRLDGPEGCSNKSAKGYGCSAWVLTNKNMDYLIGTVSW